MQKLITNLCIIRDGSKILLGKKTRKLGEGFFNGPGGKVEEDENIVDSTIREVQEEVGLKVKNLERVGKISFEFQDKSQGVVMHVFLTTDFEGNIVDSDQMKEVQWFNVGELPYDSMWADDRIWLPMLLEGKKIEAKFIFDHPSTSEHPGNILSHILTEVVEIQDEIGEIQKKPWKIK